MRWRVPNARSRRARQDGGNTGQIRVIYYWTGDKTTFYVLLAYDKRQQDSLTQAQGRQLTEIVQQGFK